MSAGLDRIFALVNGHEQLLLNGAMFPELGDALSYLGVGDLAIGGASALLAADKVTVDGKADALGQTALAVHLEVTGDSAHTVTLSLAMPPSWRFPSTFAALPPSFKPVIDDLPGPFTLQSSILGDLKFAEAAFIAQNVAAAGLKQGLNFSGRLADNTLFGNLSGLLGIGATPALTGTVALNDKGAPTVSLSVGLGKTTLDVGTFLHFGPVGIVIRTTKSSYDETLVVTAIELDGTIKLGTTDPAPTVTFSTPVHGSSSIIDFAVDVPDKSVSLARGVAALAELAGGHASDLDLPSGINVVESLALETLAASFDPSTGRVRSLRFAVGSDQKWDIVPGFVSVSSLSLAWFILMPFNAPNRSVTAIIAGTLTFGKGDGALPFDVVATSHEGFTFSGALQAGHSIDLSGLVASAMNRGSEGLPQLDVTQLFISASTNGDFALSAALTAWDLGVTGGPRLTLDSVSGNFARTSGVSTGSLRVVLTLGTARLYLAAAISGSGGLQFSGGTYGLAQEIDLTAVAADILKAFGVTLPASMPAFVLSQLNTTFDTGTKHFTFAAASTLEFDSTALDITLNIDLTPAGGSYTGSVTCELKIAGQTFHGEFSKTSTDRTVLFTWVDTGRLTFEDIAKFFGFTMPALPEQLDLALKGASFFYDFDAKSVALTGESEHGTVTFGSFLGGAGGVERLYVFDLDLNATVTLSDLPMIGSTGSAVDIGITELQIIASSKALTAADMALAVTLRQKLGAKAFISDTIGSGLTFAAQLTAGGTTRPLAIPVSAGDANPPATTPATTAPAAGTDGTKWFAVQKKLGPLDFQRIGVGYTSGNLRFALDAGVAYGPLSLSFEGLTVSTPLTKFSPSFDISGIGIAYNKPPVEIAGALLKLPADPASGIDYQFDGAVVIKTADFTIAGIGSYAKLSSGDPSLFVFAQLQKPLGGPPAFFVTGLMAGFGFNRTLAIPAQDEVLQFPLLSLTKPAEPGKDANKHELADVLSILEGRTAAPNAQPKQWIAPQKGSYWLAAGVQFTSFKLINSQALLVMELSPSDEVTFALLGLSTMQLPIAQGSTPYAYVEMQIRVVLEPQRGSFEATAVLSSNSYVLTPDCHLTGGFAYSLWFGPNEHAGDFVITQGGYHPAFKPPAHYPRVPRLGFNWAVSDNVSITGEAYFALTPSCVMAGGGLEVLFHDGDLRAWFTAHADVLISWRPFSFLADIDVSIGVSYRMNLLFAHVTITVSLGASLTLWGPPTGGRVHIHVVCVSFTVNFGSDNADDLQKPLDWTGFRSMLPESKAVCTLAATGGLAKMMDAADSDSGKRWVVRPRGFSFTTQSVVPASRVQYDPAPSAAPAPNASAPAVAGTPLAIRPMNKASGAVAATHIVAIELQTTATSRQALDPGRIAVVAADAPIDRTKWTLQARAGNVPAQLWGAPPATFSQSPASPNDTRVIGGTIGCTVFGPDTTVGFSPGPVVFALLQQTYIVPADPPGFDPTVPGGQSPLVPGVAPSTHFIPTVSDATLDKIAGISGPGPATARTALFGMLRGAQLVTATNGPLDRVAAGAGLLYTDSPLVLN